MGDFHYMICEIVNHINVKIICFSLKWPRSAIPGRGMMPVRLMRANDEVKWHGDDIDSGHDGCFIRASCYTCYMYL